MDTSQTYQNSDPVQISEVGDNPLKKVPFTMKLTAGLFIVVSLAVSAFAVSNILINKTALNNSQAAESTTYDVVVAGAGTGGVGAAIQAARMGSKVLLLEETNYIGGQMAASGVSSVDVGDNKWNTGIYKEFEDKIRSYYSSLGLKTDTSVCWTGSCFEPKVVRDVLNSMIQTAGQNGGSITLLTKTKVVSVQKTGNQITGVTLSNNQVVSSKILIDATEYGDVIPLTGAGFRVGNGTNTSPNPNACIQDITYTSVMKYYPNGVPSGLKISTPPTGYNADVRARFATIVKDGGKTSWNPAITPAYPVNWSVHNTYRGMPNSTERTANLTKTGINWANDYPAPLPYIDYSNGITLNAKYLTDLNYRRQINCEAKLKTYQFMYYVQEAKASGGLGESSWAIANDEAYEQSWDPSSPDNCANIPDTVEMYMPPIPYVRESIRLVGSYTLTGKDIYRSTNAGRVTKNFASSIAIGTYGDDLHNCNTNSTLESSLGETEADRSTSQGVYQIPLESLISNSVTGLIAAEKNISQSRLASGATRVQPTTMLVGQAAGALGSLAAKQNISPSSVKVLDVQRAVLNQKSMLYPFLDVLTNKYFVDMELIALRGIMVGYSNLNFGASDILTRGQTAVVIGRTFNIQPITISKATFVDVPPTHMFASFIEGFKTAGFTSGCQATPLKFCPDDNVTNAQFAIFALRGWTRINPLMSVVIPTVQTYTDVPTNHMAFGYIEGLATRGIKWYCNETQKQFCPDSKDFPVKRDVAAYILNSILTKEGK